MRWQERISRDLTHPSMVRGSTDSLVGAETQAAVQFRLEPRRTGSEIPAYNTWSNNAQFDDRVGAACTTVVQRSARTAHATSPETTIIALRSPASLLVTTTVFAFKSVVSYEVWRRGYEAHLTVSYIFTRTEGRLGV